MNPPEPMITSARIPATRPEVAVWMTSSTSLAQATSHDGELERAAVAVRRDGVDEPGHRVACLLPRRLARGGHRHHRAARITVAQDDHLLRAGVDARQQDGGLVGLGSGVAQEDPLEIAGQDARDRLGEIGQRGIGVQRRGVHQGLRLADDRFGHLGMAVADAHGQHAAEAIEVLPSRVVPHMQAFAAHQRQRLLVVGGDAGEQVTAVLLGRAHGGCRRDLRAARPVADGLPQTAARVRSRRDALRRGGSGDGRRVSAHGAAVDSTALRGGHRGGPDHLDRRNPGLRVPCARRTATV